MKIGYLGLKFILVFQEFLWRTLTWKINQIVDTADMDTGQYSITSYN